MADVVDMGHDENSSESARYLTTNEAAAYLRFPSVPAFRMAISRGHIQPTARRGRVLLFTKADLDEQGTILRTIDARPVSPSSNASAKDVSDEDNDDKEGPSWNLPRRR